MIVSSRQVAAFRLVSNPKGKWRVSFRVFLSSTLMAGLTLVKEEEKHVDKLDGDDATLMSEAPTAAGGALHFYRYWYSPLVSVLV